jgi:ribosomal protein S27E
VVEHASLGPNREGGNMEATQPSRYIAMPVDCTECGETQIVHIRARTGFRAVSTQAVKCLRCSNVFEAAVPDEIIAGPFPKLD